jgi:LPPG:FO 2-phospho-L-lactate transferase
MSDQKVRTKIKTTHGTISFQEYFVKNRTKDEILDILYSGAEKAKPAPGIIDIITNAQAIILAPSNPLVSIGTILSVPGMREALKKTKAKIVPVSPLIKGATIKGPADRMMKSMGIEPSALGVAKTYHDFLNGMIIDTQDKTLQNDIEKIGIKVLTTNTIMSSKQTKKILAKTILEFIK